ncbi:hypothetical protein [Enteroccous phage Ef212]|nr:hypothetical protein [Enteroccous phage Ef212]
MTMDGMTDKQLLSHTKLELVSYIRQLEQALVTNASDTSDTTEQPTTQPTTKPKVSYDIFSNTNNNKNMWGF